MINSTRQARLGNALLRNLICLVSVQHSTSAKAATPPPPRPFCNIWTSWALPCINHQQSVAFVAYCTTSTGQYHSSSAHVENRKGKEKEKGTIRNRKRLEAACPCDETRPGRLSRTPGQDESPVGAGSTALWSTSHQRAPALHCAALYCTSS